MSDTENQGKSSERDYDVGFCKPPAEAQFKPGKSGNPAGRPKGSNYKTRFRDLLEKYATYKAPQKIIDLLQTELTDIPEGVTIEEAEAFRVHLAALSGEQWAFDRLHDKPGQAVDVTTNGENINTAQEIFRFQIIDAPIENTDDNKNQSEAESIPQ